MKSPIAHFIKADKNPNIFFNFIDLFIFETIDATNINTIIGKNTFLIRTITVSETNNAAGVTVSEEFVAPQATVSVITIG